LNRQKGLIYDDNLKPKPAFDSILVRLQTYEPPKDTAKQDSVVNDSTAKDSTAKDSTDAIRTIASPSKMSMHIAGRTLFVTGESAIKPAKVDIFDTQGRPVFSASTHNGTVDLKNVAEGLYVVRVRSGSSNQIQRIAIK
jgi:endo-1,4-beta-xylanase